MSEITIRNATAKDVPTMMALVRELAEFENSPNEVMNTEAKMIEEGFGQNPAFHAIVAEVDKQVIGMSVFYFSYSTWKGKSIYIDDIIVNEAFRGKGVGSKLMEATISRAKNENVGKLHWQVLDWNDPAIRFYQKYEADFDPEWVNCSIIREKLANF
jgi:GNAT superfamily N-acetyltransferase